MVRQTNVTIYFCFWLQSNSNIHLELSQPPFYSLVSPTSDNGIYALESFVVYLSSTLNLWWKLSEYNCYLERQMNVSENWREESRMDNPETHATLSAQDTVNTVCSRHRQHCVPKTLTTLCAQDTDSTVCSRHRQHCVLKTQATLLKTQAIMCAQDTCSTMCSGHRQQCVLKSQDEDKQNKKH